MSLDPTARIANVKDSIKRYFHSNASVIGSDVVLSFDRGLNPPKLQGTLVEKWVSFQVGELERGSLSDLFLRVVIGTRKDNEGYKLSQLVDKVYGLLVDETQSDSMARIPFYRSKESGPWELLGSIIVQSVSEGPELDGEDETKYKLLTVRLRWASAL